MEARDRFIFVSRFFFFLFHDVENGSWKRYGAESERKRNEKRTRGQCGRDARRMAKKQTERARSGRGPPGSRGPPIVGRETKKRDANGARRTSTRRGAVDPSEGGRGPPTIRNGSRKGGAKEARRTRARGAADPQKGGRGPPKIRKGTKERNANEARRTRARGVVDPKRGVVDPQKES